MSVEPDPTSRAIMSDSLGEEFKHFSMDLEFLLRRTPQWREFARGVLFQDGDIVAHGEASEEAVTEGGTSNSPEGTESTSSLGIGLLREGNR